MGWRRGAQLPGRARKFARTVFHVFHREGMAQAGSNIAPTQATRRSASLPANPPIPGASRPSIPMPRRCPPAGTDESHVFTDADPRWFGHRLQRMYDARPDAAPSFAELALADGTPEGWEIELLQIDAYEAGRAQWWLCDRVGWMGPGSTGLDFADGEDGEGEGGEQDVADQRQIDPRPLAEQQPYERGEDRQR